MEATLNTYLLKALDAYPYSLEETHEALDYALSYDDKNVHALCLKGWIYAANLKEYEIAKEYFVEAMSYRIESPIIYPYYATVLIWNEDYAEAQKLLQFALKIKGVDKAVLYSLYAYVLEVRMQYKPAVKSLKEGLKHSYNSNFTCYLKNEISRIKDKYPKRKKKKKVAKN